MNIKKSVTTGPPSLGDSGSGAGTALSQHFTCVRPGTCPHSSCHVSWYGVPSGFQAPEILSTVFSPWSRILQYFIDCRSGRLWRGGNNYSHRCSLLIWGHSNIHRSLCYHSQPSLFGQQLSVFLTFKGFHSSPYCPCERTEERCLFSTHLSPFVLRWLPYTETQVILLMPLRDPFTLQDSAQFSANDGQNFLLDIAE